MNRDNFKKVFTLALKQPWLKDKILTLDYLLYNECQSEEERSLVIELLEQFTHVDSEKYSELMNELVESIVTDPMLKSDTTQIVAMTGDYNSDSGQFVLYGLKPIFEKFHWREHLSVTNFQKSLREFRKQGCAHKNLILVDEFVGSGKTVIGRVNRLRQMYKEAGVGVSVSVKVLAASKVGIDNIVSQEIDIESMIELGRGISDRYSGKFKDDKLSTMNNLEQLLSDKHDGRTLPNLGYGKTESLYVRDGGNTPNSVFPIFWWPFLATGKDRETLLIRAMGDA